MVNTIQNSPICQPIFGSEPAVPLLVIDQFDQMATQINLHLTQPLEQHLSYAGSALAAVIGTAIKILALIIGTTATIFMLPALLCCPEHFVSNRDQIISENLDSQLDADLGSNASEKPEEADDENKPWIRAATDEIEDQESIAWQILKNSEDKKQNKIVEKIINSTEPKKLGCDFDIVPDELVLEIFTKYISLKDLSTLARTSKPIYKLVNGFALSALPKCKKLLKDKNLMSSKLDQIPTHKAFRMVGVFYQNEIRENYSNFGIFIFRIIPLSYFNDALESLRNEGESFSIILSKHFSEIHTNSLNLENLQPNERCCRNIEAASLFCQLLIGNPTLINLAKTEIDAVISGNNSPIFTATALQNLIQTPRWQAQLSDVNKRKLANAILAL